MRRLPLPDPGAESSWVERELQGLFDGPVTRSSIRGGQTAADRALNAFDVTGYARRRNEVWPDGRRGASRLSPYIRHGLIDLPRAWRHVEGGPAEDTARFRDELLWQEYARHLYARLGHGTGRSLRFEVAERTGGREGRSESASQMSCLEMSRAELTNTGWITNQQRMWLASHWAVRQGAGWRDGEDDMFRHLIDGSRAANRLGWQWTSGAMTGRPYGFSRSQVTKRAPGLCQQCALSDACPIEGWPTTGEPRSMHGVDPRLKSDTDVEATCGPRTAQRTGEPEAVWVTAESLGDADPALAAHVNLPAVFVFDAPLLARLQLSPVRLCFLAEIVADLGTRRSVDVWLGDPAEVLAGRRLAATFTPVPGWRRLAQHLDIVEIRPWVWLRPPRSGSVNSYSAWRR